MSPGSPVATHYELLSCPGLHWELRNGRIRTLWYSHSYNYHNIDYRITLHHLSYHCTSLWYTSVAVAPNVHVGTTPAWLGHSVQCMLSASSSWSMKSILNILLQSLTHSSTDSRFSVVLMIKVICRTDSQNVKVRYAAGLYTSAGEWLNLLDNSIPETDNDTCTPSH